MIDKSCCSSSVSFTGRGVTSKQMITVDVELAPAGSGITFELRANDAQVNVPASAGFVVNTLRNVVLGAQGVRLCIVEHFLAAASLWGLDDLIVRVDGPEMPLGDGSALFWIDLFKKAGWERKAIDSTVELNEPIVVKKGDRMLMALPDERFSMSYHMDWNHPLIGKRWQRWEPSVDPIEIASARTFGSLKEHQLLGLTEEVVTLTETGFSQPLRFEDEPVRHKLLDLIGDLRLSGVNPMAFKASFVSIKAGHELDVDLARRLAQIVERS